MNFIFQEIAPKYTLFALPLGPLESNCTVLRCSSTGRLAVIDPGGESDWIESYIQSSNSVLSYILLTHAHFDHCLGIPDLMRLSESMPVTALHPADNFLYVNISSMARRFGIVSPDPELPIDLELYDGQIISVGSISLEVIHTPGHSPGSVCYYIESANLLIAGDTIFQGSVGRTDLPGGDSDLLISSIRDRIYSLPERTRIISGHGPATTVGAEMAGNFFIRA